MCGLTVHTRIDGYLGDERAVGIKNMHKSANPRNLRHFPLTYLRADGSIDLEFDVGNQSLVRYPSLRADFGRRSKADMVYIDKIDKRWLMVLSFDSWGT